jgi:hypothetical protein
MKKIFILIVFAVASSQLKAQTYPFIEDFNSMTPNMNPSGWTSTTPGFLVIPDHGDAGSQGLTGQMTVFGPPADSVITPLIGPITTSSVLSIQYRIMEIVSYPCCAYTPGPGDAIDFYAVAGPLALPLYSVDMTNHIPDTGFTTLTYNVSALAGNVGSLMIKVRRASGEFFADFDNISITDISNITSPEIGVADPFVYPNPAADGTRLHLKDVPADNYKVRLITAGGSVVDLEEQHITADSTPLINTRQLNRGLYFLQLSGVHNNFLLRFVVRN